MRIRNQARPLPYSAARHCDPAMLADQGMYAEDIRRGTIIDGLRVVRLSPGRLDGRDVISVRLDDGTRVGQRRTYSVGQRVPGTRRPTTHAMPAGPVRTGGQPIFTGKRFGRGEGESAADAHSRLMAGVVYG